jgi:hypothetical protein
LGLLRIDLIYLKSLLHNVTFVQRFVTFSLGVADSNQTRGSNGY